LVARLVDIAEVVETVLPRRILRHREDGILAVVLLAVPVRLAVVVLLVRRRVAVPRSSPRNRLVARIFVAMMMRA
jgi:hypothetical protein